MKNFFARVARDCTEASATDRSCLALVALICLIGCEQAKEFVNKTTTQIQKKVESVSQKSQDTSTAPPRLTGESLGQSQMPSPKEDDAAGDEPKAETKSVPQESSTSTSSPPTPAKPLPEEVIASFLKLPVSEISDTHLEQLAALESGLEKLTVLNLSASKVTRHGLQHVEKFYALTELNLAGMDVTSDAMSYIGKLKELQVLVLQRCRAFDDSAAAYLGQLTSLRDLNLRETPVSDVGLVHLAKLTNLERLDIGLTTITGSSFDEVKGLDLKVLLADGSRFGTYGLAYVARSKSLEELDISSAGVNDASVRRFRGSSSNLRRLNLARNPDLTDPAFVHLIQSMKNLEYLNLHYCSHLTDRGLAALRGLKNLRELNLANTYCSRQTAEALKKAIPEVNINL